MKENVIEIDLDTGLRDFTDVEHCRRTAVGDGALFQSNHSSIVDGDARRSIPLSERDTPTVVLCFADVADCQYRRYRVVLHVSPGNACTSTGGFVHCPNIGVSRWIRHALLLRI